MSIEIVFETHALSEDNERGIATGQRVMIVGHLAAYRALEHVVHQVSLEELMAAEFTWREDGWEYTLR